MDGSGDRRPRRHIGDVAEAGADRVSGRPELLAAGHGWMATRRFTGSPLIEAWPSLSERARRGGTAQLAAMLRTLHAARASAAPIPMCSDRPRLHALSRDRLLQVIEASQYVPGAEPELPQTSPSAARCMVGHRQPSTATCT